MATINPYGLKGRAKATYELRADLNELNRRIKAIEDAGVTSYSITRARKQNPRLFNQKGQFKIGVSKYNLKEIAEIQELVDILLESKQTQIEEIEISNRARLNALRETLDNFGISMSNTSDSELQQLLESGLVDDLLNTYGSPNAFEELDDMLASGLSIEDFIKLFKDGQSKFISKAELDEIKKQSTSKNIKSKVQKTIDKNKQPKKKPTAKRKKTKRRSKRRSKKK